MSIAMKKKWFEEDVKTLSTEAKTAKSLVQRICRALSTKRAFLYPMIDKYCHDYEGQIHCVSDCKDCTYYDECGSDSNDGISLLFWGGHFSARGKRKINDPKSRAWISLLEDCIGQGECGSDFSLYNHAKDLRCMPGIDITCKSVDELKTKLDEIENHMTV